MTQLPNALADATPAQKLVYLELADADGPLTVATLVQRTHLHQATVCRALNALRDEYGRVAEAGPGTDARTTRYRAD